MSGAPIISVVICAYRSRARIDTALASLAAQDTEDTFEVIVVASGGDDTPEYLARQHPWVKVVSRRDRLYPGPARNLGVGAARARLIAFLPDDGIAAPDWLRRRIAMHRQGYDAVGGSITNATPGHPVGTAGYLLEYSALLPSDRILGEQAIPHCLSYRRTLFERHGAFPEDTETGEDTLFNRRLVEAGVRIGFDAGARLGHRNPTGLRAYLGHQRDHGRGLMQCVAVHGFASPIGTDRPRLLRTFWRAFVTYPLYRWTRSLGRSRRAGASWLASYFVLSPLIWAGIWATSTGIVREYLALARESPRGELWPEGVDG